MKILKTSYLLFLSLFIVSIVGCTDDDDDHMHGDNEITITILEPAVNEVVSDCSDVHIHVEIEATDENHEVEIVLHPEGDTSDKIIDFDEHNHDQKIVFEQDRDLCSYGATACFHLEVKACKDHDCEETVEADVEFCLQ